MYKETGFTWKLGMFVTLGLAMFVIVIYFIGQQQNLFGSTFQLQSKFSNVSGLKLGNNVRFSGINVGTVTEIAFISDTLVMVKLTLKEEVQKYIKTDAMASIGSDGLMGDKVLTISPGLLSKTIVKDNDLIQSTKAVEMEELMKSVKTSVDNAQVITKQLAEFSQRMNSNDGLLSKIMTDASFANKLDVMMTNLEMSSYEFATFSKKINDKDNVISKLVSNEKLAKSLDSTVINIENATKGLNEIEEAAKNNFLLKGYFNKKKKEAAKKLKATKKAAPVKK
jgi:phospholipid/cholesterol/gamma-HCH transport system substrate-binding protein